MSTVSNPQKKLRIFLCHSSDDKLQIRKLYSQFIKDGFAPWLDEEDLLPGQVWGEEIPKAVRKSDIVVVCLSKNSVSKTGYVQKEIKIALDVADQQPEGTIFIIPVKLEECEVPNRLSRWQWVNLFEENGYNRLKSSLTLRTQAFLQDERKTTPAEAKENSSSPALENIKDKQSTYTQSSVEKEKTNVELKDKEIQSAEENRLFTHKMKRFAPPSQYILSIAVILIAITLLLMYIFTALSMKTFWETVFGAVGIGGIVIATVFYIFREVIRRKIFPQLLKVQAYNLLNRIIIFIFITGVLGIVSYFLAPLYRQNKIHNESNQSSLPILTTANNNNSINVKTPSSTPVVLSNANNIRNMPTTSPTLVTAQLSGTVFDENGKRLQGARVTLDYVPGIQPVETSSDGVFTLDKIPKKYGEMVRIRITLKGYLPNPYIEDVVLGADPPVIKLKKVK